MRQTRLSPGGSPVGTAISIRGNEPNPDGTSKIRLQRSIGSITARETFAVQRPIVTLEPRETLSLTSHDGRSPNLTLIGSTASFGMPSRLDRATGRETGGETGLVTTGSLNGGFGMNVRNASRALIGRDAATGQKLDGTMGQVALDGRDAADAISGGWATVVRERWRSNSGMSLVRVNS
jgi:hypothetical protein